MRVEQALYIIAAFGVKWLFPYKSINLLNMKPTQTSFFEHQMDSKIFIRTNGHWILNIAELCSYRTEMSIIFEHRTDS